MDNVAGLAEVPGRVHYSTGRLTAGQAQVMDRWRARLLEDEAPPGQPEIGLGERMLGGNNRPRCSCSDAIAAAVQDLLTTRRPTGLDLARYAEAYRKLGPADQPVSFYLPGWLAAEAEQLRAEALADLREELDKLRARAREEHPVQPRAQALAFIGAAARQGLPTKVLQVPRGALGRMALDRWAGRPVEQVVGAAYAYARDAHAEPHRARRDMRKIRR